jgi:TPR repeat protein
MKSWDFIKTKSADCTTVHEHLECIRKPKSSFGFGILWQISLCFLSLPILSCHADVKKGIHLIYTGKSQEGLAELEKSVEAGDEQALFYSALVHLFGSAPTPQKGLPLLEKAVHKGYGPALDTYAGLYLHGHFVPQDSRKALIYYEISAQRGYGPSQFNCGILYKNGEKIPKDLEKAFYYLTLAALNREDLDEISEDAAQYRNEVVASMTKEQYQRALSRFARKHKKPKGKAR